MSTYMSTYAQIKRFPFEMKFVNINDPIITFRLKYMEHFETFISTKQRRISEMYALKSPLFHLSRR